MAIRRIGLTGGIGSGKSTVARCWVAQGAQLVDTDAIAHAVTAPGGEAIPMLRQEFGDAVIDEQGALDRSRMRELAFADPSSKRRLEAILHPLIGAEAWRQAAATSSAAIVFDVPLLTEGSLWRARCDRIVVVDCSESAQIERVMRRSSWTADQVRHVIAQQASRDSCRAIADAVIDNDAHKLLATLELEAQALWRLWIAHIRAGKSL